MTLREYKNELIYNVAGYLLTPLKCILVITIIQTLSYRIVCIYQNEILAKKISLVGLCLTLVFSIIFVLIKVVVGVIVDKDFEKFPPKDFELNNI